MLSLFIISTEKSGHHLGVLLYVFFFFFLLPPPLLCSIDLSTPSPIIFVYRELCSDRTQCCKSDWSGLCLFCFFQPSFELLFFPQFTAILFVRVPNLPRRRRSVRRRGNSKKPRQLRRRLRTRCPGGGGYGRKQALTHLSYKVLALTVITPDTILSFVSRVMSTYAHLFVNIVTDLLCDQDLSQSLYILHRNFLRLPPMGCGAAEAAGLVFVCFVIHNVHVLLANRVDLGFFFFCLYSI